MADNKKKNWQSLKTNNFQIQFKLNIAIIFYLGLYKVQETFTVE